MDVVIFVSGSGSNLKAIHREMNANRCAIRIRGVLSDKADAKALEWAEAQKIPTAVEALAKGDSRIEWCERLVKRVKDWNADWVVLAGFMRVLSPNFVKAFPDRVINIHPALLPSFPGAHGVRDALIHGAMITGCTVHLVDAGVDTGRILAQGATTVSSTDDEDSLRARIQKIEHRLYPSVLHYIATQGLPEGILPTQEPLFLVPSFSPSNSEEL